MLLKKRIEQSLCKFWCSHSSVAEDVILLGWHLVRSNYPVTQHHIQEERNPHQIFLLPVKHFLLCNGEDARVT